MREKKSRKEQIKDGIIVGLPLIFGFFPVAMAFGLLSKNTGISLRDTSLFSLMVYAGASQFMALDLIMANVSLGGIILATFLLNLRHLMMSASLSRQLKDVDTRWLPLVAHGITDESFSVASFNKDKLSIPFLLALNISGYISWNLGTISGHILGEILPQSVQASLGIGLYAMFVALLVPEIKKSREVLYLSLISAIVYIFIFNLKIFTSGWDIILGIIISSVIGVILFDGKTREVE